MNGGVTVKPETSFKHAMTSVTQSLERASETLNNCVFSGPCSVAAMKSRLDLMRELSSDEPAEIGVSPELLEKYGVV